MGQKWGKITNGQLWKIKKRKKYEIGSILSTTYTMNNNYRKAPGQNLGLRPTAHSTLFLEAVIDGFELC